MVELAEQVGMIEPDANLPKGVIVGTAVISNVIAPTTERDLFQWVLTDVIRLASPRKPKGHPQPMWFHPF